MTAIPVVLITGYLGAGKTTFLNHLLSLPAIRERKKVLIINEFGSLGVDGELVEPGDYRRFDLNKGSLFCICIKTDFLKTLSTIANEVRPELCLVEATGVADPCDLEGFLDAPDLAGRFRIEASLCIVDALNFTKVAPYMRPSQNQVKRADGIIVNKADLVDKPVLSCLHAVLCSLNPHVPQEAVSFGRMSESFLDRVRHARHKGTMATEPPKDIKAVSLQLNDTVPEAAFMTAVRALGEHLLRLKGTVDFGAGPVLLQGVFDRIEQQEPPAAARGKRAVVIIVQGLEPEAVQRAFADFVCA